MDNKVRPDLSKKNKYWISKHRFYELKHFCLQYPEWRRAYLAADPMARGGESNERVAETNKIQDPTGRCAEIRIECLNKMKLIKECCKLADPYLAEYIFKAVTANLGYNYLKSKLEIPCSKDMYYDRYRKFFWYLSRARK